MKYEEIALNEALELSDAELETIAGGQRGEWSEGQGGDNDDWWRRCRRNGNQGFWGQDFGGQDFGGQGYDGQNFGGQGYDGQNYDGDDWQRRCRRR